MRIETPATLTADDIAWEGDLQSLGETFRGGRALARVALGKPAWWPAAAALEAQTGQKWSPPAGDRRYTLVRLSCTLYPPAGGRAHYQEASLSANLSPANGRGRVNAFDLFPDRITAPRQGKFSLKLTPQLKFVQAIDAKLGEAGVEITYPYALPVVQSYGRGQSRPQWQFNHQPDHPLQGDLSVYLVLDAPAGADTWLALELVTTLETRYGPIRLALPQTARAHLAQAIH